MHHTIFTLSMHIKTRDYVPNHRPRFRFEDNQYRWKFNIKHSSFRKNLNEQNPKRNRSPTMHIWRLARPANKRNKQYANRTYEVEKKEVHMKMPNKQWNEKLNWNTKNATDIERRENYLSLNNLKYGGVFDHSWLPTLMGVVNDFVSYM